ncbi:MULTISPECIES: NmrA/HSCARG family protein [Streptomyces]|uniref:NmrA/HSCARG family protein n=1 Tax=Streptomyces evansiae TaxID=3075535 RepID=A0ABU2R973_9ACTN|nr:MULTISPECIES: NmrA/HSCARG family protein [unclassified Streptomyces]MDT0413247.1 NmrA/HSCARG family protein [Streptomyces sp. DSM 41979]MYQ58142.1 NmrA family NAD(P)-binding protein [Streptomyces sp. SID4926]SCE13369.1 Nucleoside-diphosphate-sugar epimerase [Streptomyces sp. DfronAA-171]
MPNTLVIGGTGAMGSRVVARLLDSTEVTVHVATRNPSSARAQALYAEGGGRVRLVQCDVDDDAVIREVMTSVDRVFCNTDFFSSGSVQAEHDQGVRILEAARAAGVGQFIWSSLDYAVFLTGGRVPAPHYDSKGSVAAHIGLRRADEMMRKEPDGWYTHHVSVLTTAPYFENFQLRLAPRPETLADGRDGLVFAIPLGNGRYPLIGLDDIAWFASFVFDNWHSWGARDLAVAADSLTGDQIAGIFERVTGKPAAYEAIPLEAVRSGMGEFGHDFAGMFEFFQDRDVVGLDRDLPALRAMHPGLQDFEAWLRSTGWDGAERDVQKYPRKLDLQ